MKLAEECALRTPAGPTPPHIALVRKLMGGDPRGLYLDIGAEEINKYVADFLSQDTPEVNELKEKAQGDATRVLRTALRRLRANRQNYHARGRKTVPNYGIQPCWRHRFQSGALRRVFTAICWG